MDIIDNFKSYIAKEAEIESERQGGIKTRKTYLGFAVVMGAASVATLALGFAIVFNATSSSISNSSGAWAVTPLGWFGCFIFLPMIGFACKELESKGEKDIGKEWAEKINDKFAQNKIWKKRDFTALKAHMAFVKEFAPLYFCLEQSEKEIAKRVLGEPWERQVLSCVMLETQDSEILL